MYDQRCENQIFKPISKTDRRTLNNVHHVSEFCQEIQANMLGTESKWNPNPCYM